MDKQELGEQIVEESFVLSSFERSIRLPSDCKAEHITANVEHGILKLKVKKPAPPPPSPLQQIAINAA